MPEICRFYGIIITMIFYDHAPPHFHAVYGEHEIKINILELQVISGTMPRRALAMLLDWTENHQDELLEEWKLAQIGKPLFKIKPLV